MLPKFTIKFTSKFKKDLKKFQHNKQVQDRLENILLMLMFDSTLDDKYHDHALIGNYKGHRECHLMPDVLLIYKKDNTYISLERIGSHSELFN